MRKSAWNHTSHLRRTELKHSKGYIRHLNRICTGLLLIFIVSSSALAQTTEPIRVAVTQPGMIPIVRYIGSSGVEIIEAGESADDSTISTVSGCDLIIFGYSELIESEQDFAQSVPDLASVDWPDYERHGAQLITLPMYVIDPSGFWLGFENAKAIAAAVAEALMIQGLDVEQVTARLAQFSNEIDSLSESSHQVFVKIGRERSRWVAMTPEAAYIIENMGLEIGGDIYLPGVSGSLSGFPAFPDIDDIEMKLRSGEYIAVVCPLEIKEIAAELSDYFTQNTGAQVCYVRTSIVADDNSITSQAYLNAGILLATAMQATVREKAGAPIGVHLLYSLAIFALLMYAVLLNKRLYYVGPPVVRRSEPKGKKKKK